MRLERSCSCHASWVFPFVPASSSMRACEAEVQAIKHSKCFLRTAGSTAKDLMSNPSQAVSGAHKVVVTLQRLNTSRVSSKDCLHQCQALKLDIQSSPEALQVFSSHKGVQVLLHQLSQASKGAALLDSILCCLTTALQQDQASAQAVQQQFWAAQGQVAVTEAVGFVLAGQADATAIEDSLTHYLALLMLLGQHDSADQQLQLLRVSQSVLKQSAHAMRDSVSFQSQLLGVLQQLLQLDSSYHIDGLEVLKGSKLLRACAKAVKSHSQDADVFQNAVSLLNRLLTDYSRSSCFDALVEEILDSNLALEIELAVKEQKEQGVDQVSSSASQLQLDAASTALQQLADWQAQHRDHMRADVMQVMEESSDDESTLAEGSQVNMTANASSFGTLAFSDQPIIPQATVHQNSKSQQQTEPIKAEKSRGLVSFIKGALRRR